MLQAQQLQEVFEQCNGQKDCLQQCLDAMGGSFKKGHITRQLKAMGLKRNRLTEDQVWLPGRLWLCPTEFAAPSRAAADAALPAEGADSM